MFSSVYVDVDKMEEEWVAKHTPPPTKVQPTKKSQKEPSAQKIQEKLQKQKDKTANLEQTVSKLRSKVQTTKAEVWNNTYDNICFGAFWG